MHNAILLPTLVGTLLGQRQLMVPNLGWLHQALSRAAIIVLRDFLVGQERWQFLARIRLDALPLAVTLILFGHSVAHLAQH